MPTRPAMPGTGSMPTVARSPFATPAEPEPLEVHSTPSADAESESESESDAAVTAETPSSTQEPSLQRRAQSSEQGPFEPPRFAFTEPPSAASFEPQTAPEPVPDPAPKATLETEPEPTPGPTPEPTPAHASEPELPAVAEATDDDDVPAGNPFAAPAASDETAFDSAPEPASAPEPQTTAPVPTPMPEAAATPTWGTLHPEPIEVDDDEDVVAPVPAPPASEILPSVEATDGASAEFASRASAPLTPAEGFQPEPADPVRELGASAVSNASLQAAGAPTPTNGVPMPGEETLPAFGEEQPFVPRFEPVAGVTPADRPSVSFQAPAPRPVSPLSDLELPALDEPAYQPLVDLAGNAEPSDESDHPITGEMPALRPEDLAPRSVAAVVEEQPDEMTEAEAESRRGSGPATPIASWPFRVDAVQEQVFDQDAAEHDAPEDVTPPAEQDAEEQPLDTHVPPFRREGSLDLAEADEAPFTPLATAPQFDDILDPGVQDDEAEPERPVMSWASVLGQSTEPEPPAAPEPLASEPTSSAPSEPSPAPEVEAAPAASYDDVAPSAPEHEPESHAPGDHEPGATDVAATLPFAAPVDEDAETHASPRGDEPPGDEEGSTVTSPTPRKRNLLWLWIVLGAVVVAGIGVAVYFAFLRPDAEILPTPTVTAEAPEPTAAPVAYVEPSAFLAQLPTTVGTDVLLTYAATDTLGDDSLPARAAEHYTLEYGPGSGDVTATVEAYQHYTVDEAQAAYDAYADGAIDVEDVSVDGTVVGERAYITRGSDGTVVWRNNTAVFVLTGAADDVLTFYEHFGV